MSLFHITVSCSYGAKGEAIQPFFVLFCFLFCLFSFPIKKHDSVFLCIFIVLLAVVHDWTCESSKLVTVLRFSKLEVHFKVGIINLSYKKDCLMNHIPFQFTMTWKLWPRSYSIASKCKCTRVFFRSLITKQVPI